MTFLVRWQLIIILIYLHLTRNAIMGKELWHSAVDQISTFKGTKV